MQMRARRLPVLLLLAACHPARPLEPAVVARQAVPLGSRSWRPGAEVPLWSEPRISEIPFGELGRTPSTRLYLTFETDIASELSAQGVHLSRRTELTPVAGRYGAGLSLDEAGKLVIPVPPIPRASAAPAAAWTLEFWVQPSELGPCSVVALPDLMSLTCDASGNLMLRTPGGRDAEDVPRATEVRGAVPLAVGRWSHVGLVLDARDTHALRLVVDGQARARPLESEMSMATPCAVELGSGGPKHPLSGVIDELRLQARAANTEELQRALAAPRAVERLCITTAGAEPAKVEVWFDVLRTPRIASAGEWQRGELERVVAGARGLERVDGHWRKIEAVDPPVARTTQATAFLGEHRVFLFGGETRDSHHRPMRNTDDTWIFDTLEETWERLEPGLAPAGRCHQDAAFSPDHGVVLLAGGFNIEQRKPRLFADTWLFHVAERRWERCEGADSPQGFSDELVVYHPRLRQFVFVAGRQVRTFDPETRRWRCLPSFSVVDPRGLPLDLRPASSIGGYVPTTGEIVLFGGSRDPDDDSQFVDDLCLLDLDARRITMLPAPSAAGERPSPRVRSGFGWDSKRERFVLFGGVRSQRSQRMGDLWSFDPGTRRWKEHQACGSPTPRGGYFGMEYDPELDRFFLLCGRHSHERFLSESWTLSLDESASGHARYVFDRSAFPGETDWFADEETPGDSRVDVRFRESADAFTWTEWSTELPSAQRYVEVELTLAPGSRGEAPRVAAMGFRAPR